jgi:ATP-binding cassette subfamily C (CFTR/MRP) protein 4
LGHVTNLASNDVEPFIVTSVASIFLILGPLEALAIMLVGIYMIVSVFAAGYGLFVLLLPLQFYLSKRFVQFCTKVAALTNARVCLVSQAVSGARFMKMNGWELEFDKRVTKLQDEEVAKLQGASHFKALNKAITIVQVW